MKARDVMTTHVRSVGPDTAVRDIAKCLLDSHISAVPVLDDQGALLGIVSEGDLLRRCETETEKPTPGWLELFMSSQEHARLYVKTHGIHARDVMTARVATVSADTPLAAVATLLEKHRITLVPVVEDGKVTGIVSRANLLQGLATHETEGPVPTVDDRKAREVLMAALVTAGVATHHINVIAAGGVIRLWGVVESREELDAVRVAAKTMPEIGEV